MAISVGSLAPGAIQNYTDLLAAVRDMMDDDNYSQSSIDRCIRLAESYFNRELRHPRMEKSVLLALTAETSILPDDFLAMRSIKEVASPAFTLASMSPAALIETYGQTAGTPEAYAIEGRSIRIAPIGNVTLELSYYAAIPALCANAPVNWLIVNHPDLYLWGTVWYCCQRDRDSNGAAMAQSALSGILQSLQTSSVKDRWGAAPLRPRGITQVSSARA